MDGFQSEENAEDDLLKVDVAFEIFISAEDELDAYESNVQGSGYDEYRELYKLKLKQKMTSHFFAISLFHIIEKTIKNEIRRLDKSGSNLPSSLDDCASKLKKFEHGFNIRHFEDFRYIDKL